jgi:Fe-S-cluster containining protein
VHLKVLSPHDELERQVDRGALFNYGMHTSTLDRMHDLAIFVFSGLEIMIKKGLMTKAELQHITKEVREAMKDQHWTKQIGFSLNGEKGSKYDTPTAQVDCEARMPLCKGVCCYMEHPLQTTDVEEGVVQWDHARPYWIRKKADGACAHLAEGQRCGIFEQRPMVCRVYTCEKDPRVWKDFAARVPNTEEIEKLLDGTHTKKMIEDAKVARAQSEVDPRIR